MQPLIEDKTFDRIDFTNLRLEKGDYEACKFINCNFSGSDLTQIRFMECEFIDCNLSSAGLNNAEFQEVTFKDCKMLGMYFDKCGDFAFSIRIENCQLSHSSFYRKKLTKTAFLKTKLQEVDFTECDLSASVFEDCDLRDAIFYNTDLRKADFRNSYDFVIDPENNKIKGAKFSLHSISGLLSKYEIIIS